MKTNSVINAAIVGCGRISKKHIEALTSLYDRGVNICVAADINTNNLRSLELPADVERVQNYDDPEVLKDADLGIVLTESGNHYQHAKRLLEHGLDVVVEKPVTLRLDHAHDLKNIAQKTGKKVYVVKQNRYNPPIQKVKNFLDKGFLGKPQIGTIRVRWCRPQDYYDMAPWRGTWSMDGGVISNQASHHIDLLRWFMGDVKSVRALSRRFSAKIEAEDTIIALVEFESGAVGTIEATTSTRPKNLEGSISIQGDLGAFEVAGFAVNELRYLQSGHPNFNSELREISNKNEIDTNDVYGSGHKILYSNIIADRLGLENSVVLLDEAIQSLELIHLLYMSVEQNKTIYKSQLGAGSVRMGF